MGASTRRITIVPLFLVVALCCGYRPVSSFSVTPPHLSTKSFFGGELISAGLRRRPTTTPCLSKSTAAAATATSAVMSVKSRRESKRDRVRRVWRRGGLQASQVRDRLGAGVWDKLKIPPDGRAHDEVTFRSGCEGRTLTIPQGVTVDGWSCLWCFFFVRRFVWLVLYEDMSTITTKFESSDSQARCTNSRLRFVSLCAAWQSVRPPVGVPRDCCCRQARQALARFFEGG